MTSILWVCISLFVMGCGWPHKGNLCLTLIWPRYVHILKVYEKPIEGWKIWPRYCRRHVGKSPDSKGCWELGSIQLIQVTACNHILLFGENYPHASQRKNCTESFSLTSLWTEGSSLPFKICSYLQTVFLDILWDKVAPMNRRCSMTSFGLSVSPLSSDFFHHVGFVCFGKITELLIQNPQKSAGVFERALMRFGLIKWDIIIDWQIQLWH